METWWTVCSAPLLLTSKPELSSPSGCDTSTLRSERLPLSMSESGGGESSGGGEVVGGGGGNSSSSTLVPSSPCTGPPAVSSGLGGRAGRSLVGDWELSGVEAAAGEAGLLPACWNTGATLDTGLAGLPGCWSC